MFLLILAWAVLIVVALGVLAFLIGAAKSGNKDAEVFLCIIILFSFVGVFSWAAHYVLDYYHLIK